MGGMARRTERTEDRNMPGPVSDSYDPEWGTAANGDKIREALGAVYHRVSLVLGNQEPLWIVRLVQKELPREITATMTEREWRIVRFALERAKDSI